MKHYYGIHLGLWGKERSESTEWKTAWVLDCSQVNVRTVKLNFSISIGPSSSLYEGSTHTHAHTQTQTQTHTHLHLYSSFENLSTWGVRSLFSVSYHLYARGLLSGHWVRDYLGNKITLSVTRKLTSGNSCCSAETSNHWLVKTGMSFSLRLEYRTRNNRVNL